MCQSVSQPVRQSFNRSTEPRSPAPDIHSDLSVASDSSKHTAAAKRRRSQQCGSAHRLQQQQQQQQQQLLLRAWQGGNGDARYRTYATRKRPARTHTHTHTLSPFFGSASLALLADLVSPLLVLCALRSDASVNEVLLQGRREGGRRALVTRPGKEERARAISARSAEMQTRPHTHCIHLSCLRTQQPPLASCCPARRRQVWPLCPERRGTPRYTPTGTGES